MARNPLTVHKQSNIVSVYLDSWSYCLGEEDDYFYTTKANYVFFDSEYETGIGPKVIVKWSDK